MSIWWRTYVVPAAVFQSVIVGGGYATGREVVEYVSRHGPLGGLVACAVIAFLFGAVLATSFALAHRLRTTDYRHFLRALLGPAWILYEALFVILLVIVIAVVGSAVGAMASTALGAPAVLGTATVLVAVVILNFFGRPVVAALLSGWAIVVTVALGVLAAAVLGGDVAAAATTLNSPIAAATLSGARFAVYNSALIPVLIYCTSGIATTPAAARAGFVAGVAGVVPALLLHAVFMRSPSEVLDAAVPTYATLMHAGLAAWAPLYYLLLTGTVVLTAAGVLQGVNERLDGWRSDGGRAPLSREVHALIAGGIVLASLMLADFGIVALVARGYGMLSWGFFLVFTLPLLTIGIRRLFIQGDNHAP